MTTQKHLEQLKRAADKNALFACGGIIADCKTVKIVFRVDKEDNEFISPTDEETAFFTEPPVWREWNLGSASKTDVTRVMAQTAPQAAFGKGRESVIDLAYRNARTLDATRFVTSFSVAEWGILATIERCLVPCNPNPPKEAKCFLRAELYTLNMYSQGGHFKTHVDTPRRGGHIASLVVCLPNHFEGGALTVLKRDKHVFAWGGDASKSSVQWAAFYSDCEHAIAPVTAGMRVTLTYHLYAVEQWVTTMPVDHETTSIYTALRAALSDPAFYPQGAVLGFACQYTYPSDAEPTTLKGADLMLQQAATLLLGGSGSRVYPVFSSQRQDDSDDSECSDDCIHSEDSDEKADKEFVMVGSWSDVQSRLNETFDHHYYDSRRAFLQAALKGHGPLADKDIVWITRPTTFDIETTVAAYGNSPTTDTFYAAAAQFITIPRRSRLNL